MNAPPPVNLAGSAKHGVLWSSLSSAAVGLAQLLQIAALARILVPDEFAIAAVATIAVTVLRSYADFGLAGAIVHYQRVEEDELSTLYWFTLLIGMSLALLVAACAPLIAQFYARPQLAGVLQIISPSIIFATLGGQYRALHQKRLAFGILAFANIAAAATSCTVAVATALLGFGVYSIAFGALFASIVAAFVVVASGMNIYRPMAVFRLSKVHRLLRFGAYQVAERTLNFFNMEMDSLILGKLANMTTLGYYAPLKTLCLQPIALINPILTGVSFPIMSAVQGDVRRVARIYLFQLRAIASLTAPLYMFTVVAAKPLILCVLGPHWMEGAPILRVLALYGFLISIGNPVGSLLMATGNARRSFLWNLGVSCLVPLSILAAAPHGATVVAITMVVLQVVLTVPGWRYLIWHSAGARLGEHLASFCLPLLLAAIAAVAVLPIASWDVSSSAKLIVMASLGGGLYGVLSWFLNHDAVALLIKTAFHSSSKPT